MIVVRGSPANLLGLRVGSDIGDSLLHCVDLLCLRIRDLHRELVFERHHHLPIHSTEHRAQQ